MSTDFITRLNTADILISDGATGTNLQARGLERGTPSEVWVLENPEKIVQLHRDFIEGGADIILTSTFGANRFRISSGLIDRVHEINQRAVMLAKQSIGNKQIFVGGSIGPLGQLLEPFGPLNYAEAVNAYKEQAAALDEASVDLIVIETQFDINEANAAIEAVRSVSELPLVCSFSYDRGIRTMMGLSPSKAAAELAKSGVDVIGINCGRSLAENMQSLEELSRSTDLPIWFKPNAGLPTIDESGRTIYSISPNEMGSQAPDWVQAGARIIGGCCGTTPNHLRSIAQGIKQIS